LPSYQASSSRAQLTQEKISLQEESITISP
jgi:hypothetical protein